MHSTSQPAGAGADQFLDDLADRILGPRTLSAEELAAAAGIAVDDVEPIWMELGFAPVDRERPLFARADLQALELLVAARRHDLVSDDMAVALARVLGQALARVAATAAQTLAPLVRDLAQAADGPAVNTPTGGATVETAEQLTVETAETAEQLLQTVAGTLVPTIDRFMAYSWRRHLLAALRRHLAPRPTEVVGFADLVGFTRMTARIDPGDLPEVVARFQELATRHLVTTGGRVVKAIGDAVLFVFPDGAAAARGALGLVAAAAADPALPPMRAGLACGLVVELDGDVYGDTVNRAARLAELARSGTVLVDDDTAMQLIEAGDLVVRPLRPHRLKGLGLVRTWAVRSPPGRAMPVG